MQQTVSVAVKIDRAEAIRQGRAQYGRVVMQINPAELTQDEREILAGCGEDGGALSPMIFGGLTRCQPVIGNVDDPLAVVREILAERKKWIDEWEKKHAVEKLAEEKRQAKNFAEYEAKCADPEKWCKAHRLGCRPEVSEPYCDNWSLSAEQAEKIITLPASQAARAAAEKIVTDEIAEAIDRYTNRCADAEQWIDKNGDISTPYSGWLTSDEVEAVLALPASVVAKSAAEKIVADRAAEVAAAAQCRADQISVWVREHGTANQQARHALNLLPEAEVIDAIRDDAFAPLADLPRYVKLESGDVDHDDCYGTVAFSVDDATEVSAEQWDAMARIREWLPGAIITPRVHTAECESCDATKTRHSLHVAVTVGELTLTREYAL